MSEWYEARMEAMAERLREIADELSEETGEEVDPDDIDLSDYAPDWNDLD